MPAVATCDFGHTLNLSLISGIITGDEIVRDSSPTLDVIFLYLFPRSGDLY